MTANFLQLLRFSIVTTTWNRIEFLRDAVESVRCQEYTNYEHVFVDGGSNDGTLEFIKGLAGNIKLVENIRGGIARAMNAGLGAVSGDVILYLNSDDYLAHPRVLRRVAGVFEKYACEWMYGRCLGDVGGGWAPETSTFPAYSYARLLQGNIIPHPATFVRRRFFERVGGFEETLRYALDYDLWLRMGKLADPIQVREFLAVFRAHPGSATHANPMASFLEDHAVRQKYLGRNPLARINHGLRYLRRKRFLERALRAKGGERR
jgi:glycosyltransferase involved in cell wall biosynthesis